MARGKAGHCGAIEHGGAT